MRTARHSIRALFLLSVACAWVLGGIAVSVHFHGVAHSLDEHSRDLVHLHEGRATAGTGASCVEPADHGPHDSRQERCLHVPLALHASGLTALPLSVAGRPESSASRQIERGSGAHASIELLSLAPKLPPPFPA